MFRKKILGIALALALVTALATPLAALADTEVSGTLPAVTLDVTAPSAIDLESLYGETGDVEGTSVTPGTVLSLMNATGYSLAIKSDKSDGIMQETGSGKLADALRVTADLVDGTGAPATQVIGDDVDMTASDQVVGTTAASSPTETGTNSITLSVKQAKQITGVAGATYSLTLTFTATAN